MMKAIDLAWCVGLALASACGGSGTAPSTSGQSCAVAISGAPHGGTFESCGIVKTGDGAYALSLAGLPGCDRKDGSCSVAAKLLGGGQESCSAHGIDVVSVEDAGWTAATGNLAGTICPPGSDCPSWQPTPCTITTSSLTGGGTVAEPYGHWSGSLTAHVLGVDATGNVAVAADVQIHGSF